MHAALLVVSLLGAAVSASAAPPAQGQLYRHPTGASFRAPPGWQIVEGPMGLQLVPPDAGAGPYGPTELYVVGSTAAPGVESAGDPRVAAHFEAVTAQIFPFLRREGPPRPVKPDGIELTWAGKNPMGVDTWAFAVVRVVRGYALSFGGVGERARVERRREAVAQSARSLAWGEASRDTNLVGTWHHWSYKGGKVSGETRRRVMLAADGTAVQSSNTETVGSFTGKDLGGQADGPSAGFVVQGGNTRRGTWSADGTTLFIRWDDGEAVQARYRIVGPPGQRKVLAQPVGSRDTVEWTEQPIVL